MKIKLKRETQHIYTESREIEIEIPDDVKGEVKQWQDF